MKTVKYYGIEECMDQREEQPPMGTDRQVRVSVREMDGEINFPF